MKELKENVLLVLSVLSVIAVLLFGSPWVFFAFVQNSQNACNHFSLAQCKDMGL